MNKGSMVLYCGAEHDFKGRNNFTKKKAYKVLAGQGDGVPRNDGKLGAFIQNEHQFVVEDDRGNLRVQTITSKDWKLIKEVESTYVPKPEYKSPIQLTTSLC